MDLKAAHKLLGVERCASYSEIETAWRTAQDATLVQLRQARSGDEGQILMNQLDELQAARDLLHKFSEIDPTLQRNGVTESGQFFTKIVNMPGGDTVKSNSDFVGRQARNPVTEKGRVFLGLIAVGIVLLMVGYLVGRQYATPIASIQPSVQVVDATRQTDTAKVELKMGNQPSVVAQAKPASEKSVRIAAASDEENQMQPNAPKATIKRTSPPDPLLPNWPEASAGIAESFVTITCDRDAQVFIDDVLKGKIASGTLMVAIKPGKHKLIMTHAELGFYSEDIETTSAKTAHVQPTVCN